MGALSLWIVATVLFCNNTLGVDVENKTQDIEGPVLDVRELEDVGGKHGINDTTTLTAEIHNDTSHNVTNKERSAAINVENVDLNQNLHMREVKLLSDDLMTEVKNSIKHDNASLDEDAKKQCMTKQKPMGNVTKVPVLECNISGIEKCYDSYTTKFQPAKTTLCLENFQKQCSIRFQARAVNTTVQECHTSGLTACPGCRTSYETSCQKAWVEKTPGQFVLNTTCSKLPNELCRQSCGDQEEVEECHEKKITSVVEVPEEVCNINPLKTCRDATKLVPKLEPTRECTVVPMEKCQLKFSKPNTSQKNLVTKWCREPSQANNSSLDSRPQFYLEEMYIT